MEELIQELKADLIRVLDLQDVAPDDFDADTPLFVEGLGLDSIDALEIVVLLEKKYGIKVEDPKERKTIFYSVRNLAEFVTQQRNARG